MLLLHNEGMYETVKLEREGQVTWLTLNCPAKRNALNPTLNAEMVRALDEVAADRETNVLVIAGAGEAWCSGMDLREYFRANDNDEAAFMRARWDTRTWTYHKLRFHPKITIAAVNGWCFGGGFQPLISCDLAIAAEEAKFGLSEVNWGIIPGGTVTRDVAEVMGYRDALYYILTGKTFDGRRAKELGLVNEVVPLAQLRAAVMALAADLNKLNPVVLRSAKEAFKFSLTMDYDQSYDYLEAKMMQMRHRDPEDGRNTGMSQFLDEKAIRPGLEPYKRPV